MEREKLLLSRGPFSNLVLDFHLKGPNVFFIDIILKLLMTSKQSMVVNKVSVLMLSVCLCVGVEQKIETCSTCFSCPSL